MAHATHIDEFQDAPCPMACAEGNCAQRTGRVAVAFVILALPAGVAVWAWIISALASLF